ncbi:MAG TPA: lipid-binding SYLF domain-containing protein [Vicinamibacterales bacterium]|nr:lipid-binding SYLF domain-containing protein [Vicinamibacterales bacterium]
MQKTGWTRTCAIVTVLALGALSLSAQGKEEDRLRACATVLKEIVNIPDNIPNDLLDKSECVIVFPGVKKVAMGVGGSYGRGAMTCRTGEDFTGLWSAPTLMALEGGSIGFQLGGESTDFVLLVMNDRGAMSLLGSKVKLGADASAAAGPKGRSAAAATDVVMQAEMLSYSRSRGLFAGVSLEGSTLRPDNDANALVYGSPIAARDIVKGTVAVPSAAKPMVDVLNEHSPKNRSEKK